LQKHLRLPERGRKCTPGVLWTVLLYAAARITSLAAACAALRDAPSDTAAHDALLAGLPAFAELQRRLNRALQGELPKALRRRRQPLALDLVLIPYPGQALREEREVYRVKGHEPLRGYGTPTVTSPTGSLGTPEAIFPTLPDRACPLQALHFHDGRRPPSRPGAWPCTTQAATLPCPRRVKRRRALQACNPTEG
jgi:hypothetical protein